MTQLLPAPNNNIYNSLTSKDIDMIIECLISEKVSSKLDLAFFKIINPRALKHYVNGCNKELIKNIFCQAFENGEKDLVAKMLEIEPKLASFCQKQELELLGNDHPPQDQVLKSLNHYNLLIKL
ncbi:MAG: hypothetical protein ACRYE8_00360 [Janthinobacterium lividum]